ncbi:MAG: nucleotidyltransferase domain-containing protein [Chloroflexi bacterium]|nr:nucleotidyltransferase domain-containing protein [Chloroflexota bacterium]
MARTTLAQQQRTKEQQIPARTVEALQSALGETLVAVVLFGSRARGDAHEASDWDVLVIAEGLPDGPLERHFFLNRLLPSEYGDAVSLLARTPAEFESHIASLYLDIALDGQILYDPRWYAAERLATLRRLIRQLGLRRERTEAGDVWQWQKQPPRVWSLEWEK